MLVVKAVTVKYGAITALREVSLQVNKEEVVTVMGANGAGKSTLLNAISCVKRVNAGDIRLDDESICKIAPEEVVRLGVSHIPQGRRIFPVTSVINNLLIGAYIRNDKGEIRKDMDFFFNMFPVLKERRHQLAGTLSGGEQQMLAICRGLMSKPRLLLMDEPSMGLAPLLVRAVFKAITELVHTLGITILLAEQNVREALKIASRGYVLEVGEVVLEASSNELASHPGVLQAYLG
jgi:branched-chain amino acid transport system ATP-binding protein